MKLFNRLISLLILIPIAGCAQNVVKDENVVLKNEIEVRSHNEKAPQGTFTTGESFRSKKLFNIDPAVKLIAPPINLPDQMYEIPEVHEREHYNPPAPKYTIKKISKIDKNGHKYFIEVKEPIKKEVINKNSKKSLTKTEKKKVSEKEKRNEIKKDFNGKEKKIVEKYSKSLKQQSKEKNVKKAVAEKK